MKYIRQLAVDEPLYERQDTGRYLPEGSGMVCQDCMAAVDEKYAAYQRQGGKK